MTSWLKSVTDQTKNSSVEITDFLLLNKQQRIGYAYNAQINNEILMTPNIFKIETITNLIC